MFWSFKCFNVLQNVPFTSILIYLWKGIDGYFWKDNFEMSKLRQEASLNCRSELLTIPKGLMESVSKLFKSYLNNVQKLIKVIVDNWLIHWNQFLLAPSTVKTSGFQIFVEISPKRIMKKKKDVDHHTF